MKKDFFWERSCIFLIIYPKKMEQSFSICQIISTPVLGVFLSVLGGVVRLN